MRLLKEFMLKKTFWLISILFFGWAYFSISQIYEDTCTQYQYFVGHVNSNKYLVRGLRAHLEDEMKESTKIRQKSIKSEIDILDALLKGMDKL